MVTLEDVVPAEVPDIGQWKDALQKGLGRALLWAKSGRPQDRESLLEACLTDLRFDTQSPEGPRGPWLWELMQATDRVDQFRQPVLEALTSVRENPPAGQLCQLGMDYARAGVGAFRNALRHIAIGKPVFGCPWLGESELIELEGAAGFLDIARIRSKSLPLRKWDWDDKALIDEAIRRLGEQQAVALLEHEPSPEMRGYLAAWREALKNEASETRERQSERARRFGETTLTDVIQVVESTEGQPSAVHGRSGPLFLRGWGMYASEEDLRSLLERVFHSYTPAVIANYLHIFSNRTLLPFDERMLRLLEHPDDGVRRWAYIALKRYSHPAIRRFALDHLQTRVAERNFLDLFVKNYQSGDEELLSQALYLVEGSDDLHAMLMDVISVLAQNPAARPDVLALWAYRWNPCASCRHDAAELLVTRHAAPAWLIEECRYDSMEETRELVSTVPPRG